ncbi:iron-sulfur cluster repair di-iron protein [Chitinophaga sp. MM2321]|uniref:iron-sulfur cluster repair di-iron protein n=1 Tax=Chitinophaga sp. MM2321 TaxID=3137178 RepID=UPI0032D58B58
MSTTLEKTIGEWVASDYRTAAVFKKHNIDFCCNGNRSVEEACRPINTDAVQVKLEILQVIESAANKENATNDYKSWPLDLLADYIEKKHHRYVSTQIPVLENYLDKLCKVHGEKHPELFEIRTLFAGGAGELTMHMKKEELMLFPFIRKMVQAKEQKSGAVAASFGTVQNPIRMMMHEHDAEGERYRKIRELADSYTPPADACNTYRVTYALLNEFEEDLHLHIHLENNILFPKSIEMETAMTA